MLRAFHLDVLNRLTLQISSLSSLPGFLRHTRLHLAGCFSQRVFTCTHMWIMWCY